MASIPAPPPALLRAVNDYVHALGTLAFAGVLALWLGLLPEDTTLAGWWATMSPLAFLGPVVHALTRAAMRRRSKGVV